jgi:putative spermidine/putrescine transport system substrate-binding protein
VTPTDGSCFQTNRINVVKGAPNEAAALAFTNYALSAEAQTAFMSKLYYGSPNTKVQLPATVAKRAVTPQDSKALRVIDSNLVVQQSSVWADEWNRAFAK